MMQKGTYFPIFYDLRGARILVVGAGNVREREMGRLADLPRLAEEAGIRSPALLFVGKTAEYALADRVANDGVPKVDMAV